MVLDVIFELGYQLRVHGVGRLNRVLLCFLG
jgi:hypothetical protein